MKRLKENLAVLSALVTLCLSGAGALTAAVLYAESTYYKVAAAEQQFRQLRLDALYRDQAECDRDAAKFGRAVNPGDRGEPESVYCQRVRKQIKALEQEQERPKP